MAVAMAVTHCALADCKRSSGRVGDRVVPFLVAPAETYQDMLTIARGLLLRHGFAEAGERILVTAGLPFNIPGTTNLLKVETV